MRRRCAFAFALAIGAGACAEDDADAEPTSTSDGGAFSIDDCDELTAQAACEDALPHTAPDRCWWIDVRRPGATCDDSTVVPQCIGLSYVGMGCQLLDCPAGGEAIDSFSRSVDGVVEVFTSPECGFGVTTAGWSHCGEADAPLECACQCD